MPHGLRRQFGIIKRCDPPCFQPPGKGADAASVLKFTQKMPDAPRPARQCGHHHGHGRCYRL